MADILPFRLAPREATPEAPQAALPAAPAVVIPLPTTYSCRRWLGREAARIAGEQGRSSIKKVVWDVRAAHHLNGVPLDIATADADAVEQFLRDRVALIRALDEPVKPTSGRDDGGRCA